MLFIRVDSYYTLLSPGQREYLSKRFCYCVTLREESYFRRERERFLGSIKHVVFGKLAPESLLFGLKTKYTDHKNLSRQKLKASPGVQ